MAEVTRTEVPSTFSLIGHQARFEALARAAFAGRIPQTLLISGVPHLGKSTFARYFAQLLLCENPVLLDAETPLPCGECRACHQVNIGTHPDYLIFHPQVSSSENATGIAPPNLVSSIISVSAARKFSLKAQSSPILGSRRVMIMSQADRMNIEAQNALLKTFEEPAQGLTIILLCDNANILLPTVRSRCWEIRLGLVDDAQIETWLRTLEPDLDSDFAQSILRAAGGRPGLAWREWRRNADDTISQPRLAELEQWVNRLTESLPIAALRFSSDAQVIAMRWWEEDMELEEPGDYDLKGADSKIKRSAVALFLDQLMAVYRMRWRAAGATPAAAGWMRGLDQIRKTRHYILRNANTALALDVLFCRLLAGHQLH